MAGEAIGQNLPTFNLNAASVTARNAEYAGTPFSDADGDGSYNSYLGMNRGGSNAPGIGINTGNIEYFDGDAELPEKWTVLDQAGAGRTPQDSQHIGGDGLGAGDATVNPINVILDPNGTPDFNEEAEFVVCDAVAATGVICDTVTGAVNRALQTTAIGDVVWGVTPVT
jgi:hypothetical protein